jgi:class 3 adenylate cyclase/streptogramin lyase
MPRLPRGTVTFLFSDIEGSTVLLRQLGQDGYGQALSDYQRLVRESCVAVGGTEVDTQGDAFFFVFTRARDAVKGAADAQRALARHGWPDGTTLRARIGLHTGEASVSGERYVGLSVHRAARVGAAAAGGQVLVSQATASMVEDEDLGGLGLRDLGRHTLKDFERPVGLYQLDVPDLPGKFRAPTTRRRRRRPTTPLLIAGVAVVVVALGVPLTLITRGGGNGPPQLGPGEVGVIDPKTNRLVDEIPLRFASGLIAAGGGYIWIADPSGSTLTKIDPKTRKIVKTSGFESDAIPTGIAFGNGSVWVGVNRGRSLALLEFGPELVNMRGTIELERSAVPLSVGRESVLPAVGSGTVFALEPGRGKVSRIDGDKPVRLAEALDANSIAAGAAAVWLGGRTNVLSISAETGETLARVPLGGLVESASTSIDVGGAAVWFAATAQPKLFRISPSGTYTTFDVGQAPTAVAVGEGATWVANAADGTVTRVNPDETVDVIPLGAPPAGIVAAFGNVWTSPGS